jgi:hypothetical protein
VAIQNAIAYVAYDPRHNTQYDAANPQVGDDQAVWHIRLQYFFEFREQVQEWKCRKDVSEVCKTPTIHA